MTSIYVLIATVGRPEILDRTLAHLELQRRRPDKVIVVGASDQDIAGLSPRAYELGIHLGPKGLCAQRNTCLKVANGEADIICFIDDDFLLAADYLEKIERVFREEPDVVGVTGELVADGAHLSGFDFDEGLKHLNGATIPEKIELRPRRGLYGCNMSYRYSAVSDLRFDEVLPLYGWLEDIDFSRRALQRGRLVSSPAITGVHLGFKSGRTSGRRLGYSQIANVYYLSRKGTMQPELGRKLVLQNVMSNLLKSFAPEPWIDRRGRLYGNMKALADLMTGRINPQNVLSM